MKILYTTDLHGSQHYYNQVWKKAVLHKVDMVINGADMLPKINPVFKQQPSFIKNLEKHYFSKFEKAGIHYLCCFGNDDLRIYDEPFDRVCNQFEFIHNIAGRSVVIAGLEFIGFNLITDYPFGLKDRCRMDQQGFEFPEQRGTPSFSIEKGNGYGWKEISRDDWYSHARDQPTIEDELKALVRPKDMKKAIYVIHMPPANLGLDVCANGDRPASHAVLGFLKKEQPLLSLHGHIHESYKMTGIWQAPLGESICVQPGQGGMNPVFVIIDTDDLGMMKRYGHDTETLMVKSYHVKGRMEYIRISELPEYLREPFWDSLAGQGQTSYPGEKMYDTPYSVDFLKFCDQKGIKIKFVESAI